MFSSVVQSQRPTAGGKVAGNTPKLLVLVAGVLIGTAASNWCSNWVPVPQSERDLAPTPALLSRDDRQASELRTRLAALELQVETLEAKGEGTDAGSSPTDAGSLDVSSSDAKPAPRSASAEYEQNSRTFELESTDPAWAPAMANRIEGQFFETVSRDKIHATAEVRCRYTTCKAKVTWPDFGTAMREYMKTDAVGMDCFRQLIMAPPVDASAPYTGEIVLRCR